MSPASPHQSPTSNALDVIDGNSNLVKKPLPRLPRNQRAPFVFQESSKQPGRSTVTELEEFLNDILPRQKAAENTIHDGDAGPRIQMWSREDPVTLARSFWYRA
jgi:hypothetical protein